MKEVIECIRADEACHRDTNHFLGSVSQDIEIQTEPITVINIEDRLGNVSNKK